MAVICKVNCVPFKTFKNILKEDFLESLCAYNYDSENSVLYKQYV